MTILKLLSAPRPVLGIWEALRKCLVREWLKRKKRERQGEEEKRKRKKKREKGKGRRGGNES